MKHYLNEGKQLLKTMKKTKTGLHIQTRKNRIEVYTQKELEEQERKLAKQRDIIIQCVMLFMFVLMGILGFIIGIKS